MLPLAQVHVREADEDGTTALHMATAGGHDLVCKKLQELEKNMMLKNRMGKRPLDYIFYNNRSNLLRVGAPSAADKDFRDCVIPEEDEVKLKSMR